MSCTLYYLLFAHADQPPIPLPRLAAAYEVQHQPDTPLLSQAAGHAQSQQLQQQQQEQERQQQPAPTQSQESAAAQVQGEM